MKNSLLAWFFILTVGLLVLSVEWWKVLAVISVALYAVTILWDAFMFKDEVYKSALQPLVVTSLMQGASFALIPFVAFDISISEGMLYAFGSGVICMIGYYLYFKSMDHDQDAVVTAVMWNLMIAFVPIIAYFTVEEQLERIQYIGIALIFAGALFASYNKARVDYRAVLQMLGAVILLSVAWVMTEHSFALLELEANESVFWSGLFARSFGCVTVGLVCLFKMITSSSERRDMKVLVRKYWKVFLAIELTQVVADSLASLATSAGDISVIVGIEGLMGGFTFFFSLLSVYFFKFVYIRPELSEEASRLYNDHLKHFGFKVVGIFLVVTGAYFTI